MDMERWRRHHRHHRHPRHHRRLPSRAFRRRRHPRLLRYPRLNHVSMVPTTSASQPLLLRHQGPLHRRHCSGTKAHAVPAHAAPSPDNPGTVVTAFSTPLTSTPLGATCPASSSALHCFFLPWQYYYNRAFTNRGKALHILPECAGVYPRVSGVWFSPGFAAAPDLSG